MKKVTKTTLHIKDHSPLKKDLLMSIDWDTRDMVRVIPTQIGSDSLLLDKGDLWKALFIISKEDEQEQMLPDKYQHSRVYKKRVTIEADKDIKKGEKIIFTVDWMLPEALLPDDLKNEANPTDNKS